MKIGEKVLGKAREMIGRLIDQNRSEIDQAYMRAESSLSVSIGLKFMPSKKMDFVGIETSINFVADRIKDFLEAEISETQPNLFETIEKLRPKEGSVTISGAGQSVTLEAKKK